MEDLALLGGLPLVGIVPRMCGYRVHSLQAPLFPLSLTPGQSYPMVPTFADRAFWGFWGRLGVYTPFSGRSLSLIFRDWLLADAQ